MGVSDKVMAKCCCYYFEGKRRGGFWLTMGYKIPLWWAHEVGLAVPALFAKLVELTSEDKHMNDLKSGTRLNHPSSDILSIWNYYPIIHPQSWIGFTWACTLVEINMWQGFGPIVEQRKICVVSQIVIISDPFSENFPHLLNVYSLALIPKFFL